MTGTAGSSIYAFVGDFVDAGVDDVCDDLGGKGFSSVSLATVYHAARDLLPHNPKRVVAHRTEGVHYFDLDPSLYTGVLRPVPDACVSAGGFGAVTDALAKRAMSWQAWTVYLHNCRLAVEHPEFALTNAFGDTYDTDLCPSSAEVATYAAALTADVARLGPSLIVAESLHHTSFGHGYHHERAFVDVPPIADFLLSLCFCGSCVVAANTSGVDAHAVAARVREVIRRSIDEPVPGAGLLDRPTLADACGDQLLDYLRVREMTVTKLARRCAEIARAAGVPFGFVDQTGALKGYATGEPEGPLCADDAWRLGIDTTAVAEAVDSYAVLAYAKSPERVAAEVNGYARAIGGAARLRAVLRHGRPDFLDAANLASKTAVAKASGADAVDFYHYGLMPLTGLAAASAALADRAAVPANPADA